MGNVATKTGISLLILCLTCSAHGLAQDTSGANSPSADPSGTVYPTGLIPASPEAYRSFRHKPAYRAFLPVRVDLSKYFPAPAHQYGPTCASWATGYAARSYYSVRTEGRSKNDESSIPSPNYLYETVASSRSNCEGGYLPLVLNVLKQGAPSLKAYPASQNPGCAAPADIAAKATDFKISDWTAIDLADGKGIDNLRGELAKGDPVVIGMRINQQFMNLRGHDIWRDMSGGDTTQPGHAVVVTGYDDQLQAFRIINSWGRGWGDGGYGWIAYDTFRYDAREAYVMEVAKPPEPAPDPLVDIAGLQCAKISEDTSGGQLKVNGFVGNADDLAKVTARYKGRNAAIAVDVRPWPQCEVLQTLEKPLNGANLPVIATSAASGSVKNGATLSINVTSPDWPAYLYASYIQADGTVVTLSQPKLVPPTPLDRHTRQVFGDGLDGRSKFVVGPPFGREMVVVLAARSPLFDEPLPATLSERDYLTRLRKAIIYKPDPNQPDREISAAVAPVVTEEK